MAVVRTKKIVGTGLVGLIKEGLELTRREFSQGEINIAPDLIQVVMDIHSDLGNNMIEEACDKLCWYFANNPMADLAGETEIRRYLDSNMQQGAYAYSVDVKGVVKLQVDLLEYYRRLDRLIQLATSSK